MAKELKSVDITQTPDVLRLAEEVARTGVPFLLRKNDADVALLSPAPPTPRHARRRKSTSSDDPLASIIGIAKAADFPEVPGDVSANKHRYLAEAYDPNR